MSERASERAIMFKTHKMGIRYLNGELFSNETQWREDMF